MSFFLANNGTEDPFFKLSLKRHDFHGLGLLRDDGLKMIIEKVFVDIKKMQACGWKQFLFQAEDDILDGGL